MATEELKSANKEGSSLPDSGLLGSPLAHGASASLLPFKERKPFLGGNLIHLVSLVRVPSPQGLTSSGSLEHLQ